MHPQHESMHFMPSRGQAESLGSGPPVENEKTSPGSRTARLDIRIDFPSCKKQDGGRCFCKIIFLFGKGKHSPTSVTASVMAKIIAPFASSAAQAVKL
jgi:hypothetical protein